MTNTDIQSALDACRLAWEQHPEATYGWNIHHETQIERLTEPIETRIQYILAFKPEEEQITRFNNMRPVVSKLNDVCDTAYDTFIKAGDAYHEARNAYYKAGDVCDMGHNAYHEAWDMAHNAYHEAGNAYYEAGDAYLKALDTYTLEHLIEVPHTTWNGLSIFPRKDL